MTKFRYNAYGSVTIARAKKARRVVIAAKVLAWLIPILGLVALIMFTPVDIWGPSLLILGTFGIVALAIHKGGDVLDWYQDQKDYYKNAKEHGVRDE